MNVGLSCTNNCDQGNEIIAYNCHGFEPHIHKILRNNVFEK